MPETPEHYQRMLTKLGGTNLHGEPNFILHWGERQVKRYAVPDAFLGPYLHCWVLAEWNPPEAFGSKEELEALGIPFPSRGAYLPLFTYTNGSEPIMIDSEQLNLEVLRGTLHIVMTHKSDTLQHRYHVMKDEHSRIEAEKTAKMVALIEDGAPAFLESASFHGQLNCNSVIKQKMELLEKNIGRITNAASRFPRGGMVQAPSRVPWRVDVEI